MQFVQPITPVQRPAGPVTGWACSLDEYVDMWYIHKTCYDYADYCGLVEEI